MSFPQLIINNENSNDLEKVYDIIRQETEPDNRRFMLLNSDLRDLKFAILGLLFRDHISLVHKNKTFSQLVTTSEIFLTQAEMDFINVYITEWVNFPRIDNQALYKCSFINSESLKIYNKIIESSQKNPHNLCLKFQLGILGLLFRDYRDVFSYESLSDKYKEEYDSIVNDSKIIFNDTIMYKPGYLSLINEWLNENPSPELKKAMKQKANQNSANEQYLMRKKLEALALAGMKKKGGSKKSKTKKKSIRKQSKKTRKSRK